MGTYVYSLRKKHVEANLEAITPIDVVAFEYAYKETYVRRGEWGYPEYQRMAGRVCSLAEKAQQHYYERALEEYGNMQRDFYFAMGGLEDGNQVFKMYQCLPTSGYDGGVFESAGPCQPVGRLFKVGRGKWIVSTLCPKHKWNEYTIAHDGTPLFQCERCDAIKDERFNKPSTKFF